MLWDLKVCDDWALHKEVIFDLFFFKKGSCDFEGGKMAGQKRQLTHFCIKEKGKGSLFDTRGDESQR